MRGQGPYGLLRAVPYHGACQEETVLRGSDAFQQRSAPGLGTVMRELGNCAVNPERETCFQE